MTSLGHIREIAHNPKQQPRVWKDRRLNYGETHWDQFPWVTKYQNHEQGGSTCPGSSDKVLWARCGLPLEKNLLRLHFFYNSHTFMSFASRNATGSHGDEPRKMTSCLWQEEGKMAVLRCAWCFCCNKDPTTMKMILPDFQMERQLSNTSST